LKKNNRALLFTIKKILDQKQCQLPEKLGFSQEKITCSRKSNPYLTMRYKLKFGEIVQRWPKWNRAKNG